MLRAIAIDVQPLRRHPELRKLFLAQVSSGFGSFMTRVAVPYEIYRLTHSTFTVGVLGAVEFVAILVMALVGGALADAADRRRMVLTAEALSGLCVLILLVDVLTVDWVWPLFVGAGGLAAFYGLERPSLDAMIPRLVERDELPATSALWWGGMNLAGIAGPALGGVLLAASGAELAFAVDLATFVVGLAALAAMRAMPAPEDAVAPSLKSIGDGLRFALSRPVLLGTYIVDINAMFFGMPTALFPAFAERLGGPGVLGLLYAAPSIGAVVASATSGWAGRVRRHGRAIVYAAAAWGGFIALAGLAQDRVAGRRPGRACGRGRHDQRPVPLDDLEHHDPRQHPRPAGGHRDDLLHVRAAARAGRIRRGRVVCGRARLVCQRRRAVHRGLRCGRARATGPLGLRKTRQEPVSSRRIGRLKQRNA